MSAALNNQAKNERALSYTIIIHIKLIYITVVGLGIPYTMISSHRMSRELFYLLDQFTASIQALIIITLLLPRH